MDPYPTSVTDPRRVTFDSSTEDIDIRWTFDGVFHPDTLPVLDEFADWHPVEWVFRDCTILTDVRTVRKWIREYA